ncbi:MAG: hydroxymethylbilane synthase [Candidatus Magnetobacterium sp. LHC-1]|uniref:Porphobilinogen deaminase n=1 Tax=Candidatus Magnetobacterium casense TaxID=1455061 RepID=A0ABS6S017_9BACT|nr:hydroxymethylbilane synthase [Nitrospirota bacterium]MBV6342210.1 hydroxymethylbilane synthase [Candidatus Magnetobacterium casensis]
MEVNRIVIGTRGSKLALWQANWVRDQLLGLYPHIEVELKVIKTTGDKILDVPLSKVGGKGLFVKEIEESLLSGESDIAVHSIKDVPTEFPDGLHLSVICHREDPTDALVLSPNVMASKRADKAGLDALAEGAVVGTSSLRRSCQLLSIRPDLKIEQLRGNLDTRLRRLSEGFFDAIVLASAGLKRLNVEDAAIHALPVSVSLPAIGQGAVGIECRVADEAINALLVPLNHSVTSICVRAERAFLKKLSGGCQVPIAAHACFTASGTVKLDGLVGSVDGVVIIRGHAEGTVGTEEVIGTSLADDMLRAGAKEILDEVYGNG